MWFHGRILTQGKNPNVPDKHERHDGIMHPLIVHVGNDISAAFLLVQGAIFAHVVMRAGDILESESDKPGLIHGVLNPDRQ